MDQFTTDYLICALWSTNDESTPQGGEPLDKNYGIEDIAPETLARMVEDCQVFQRENLADIESDLGQAGHDFWLTRNGHGAGFWDGDWPEAGDRLTKVSKRFGEFDLYVGDDGLIYN
jgi:hypothetical protein